MINFRVDHKVAIVTGCNKGIGLDIAIALAESGADIIGVSSKMKESGHEVANAVAKAGRKFYAYNADFTNRDSIYQFINDVQKDHSKIDILINNAGHILRNPVAEHSDEYWDRVISINLDAQFLMAREIGKKMLERGSGKIIFTCSLLTFQGGINVISYAASKAALSSVVKGLSNEWASKGINVNGIAPGYIETDNTAGLIADPVRFKAISDRIPAGRWGKPADFKGPIVFLASDASAYVSGEILTVDGGWMGR